MKYLKVLTTALLTGSLLLASPVSAASFKDVPSTHWANDSINWAVDQGIVTGLQDGTFHPSDYVTEEQFISMFVRAYKEVPDLNAMPYWSYKYYAEIGSKNYPINKDRKINITRKWVAEFVAATQGKNYLGNDAIKYVLANGLAKGKTESTVVGFRGADRVTRAEAVAMIKNVIDKRMSNELLERPLTSSDISEIEHIPMGVSTDRFTDKEKENIIYEMIKDYLNLENSEVFMSGRRFEGDILIVGSKDPDPSLLVKLNKINEALRDTEYFVLINTDYSPMIGIKSKDDMDKSIFRILLEDDNKTIGYFQYWSIYGDHDYDENAINAIVKTLNAWGIPVGDTFVKTLKATDWDGKVRSFKSGSTRYYITCLGASQGIINPDEPW